MKVDDFNSHYLEGGVVHPNGGGPWDSFHEQEGSAPPIFPLNWRPRALSALALSIALFTNLGGRVGRSEQA